LLNKGTRFGKRTPPSERGAFSAPVGTFRLIQHAFDGSGWIISSLIYGGFQEKMPLEP